MTSFHNRWPSDMGSGAFWTSLGICPCLLSQLFTTWKEMSLSRRMDLLTYPEALLYASVSFSVLAYQRSTRRSPSGKAAPGNEMKSDLPMESCCVAPGLPFASLGLSFLRCRVKECHSPTKCFYDEKVGKGLCSHICT